MTDWGILLQILIPAIFQLMNIVNDWVLYHLRRRDAIRYDLREDRERRGNEEGAAASGVDERMQEPGLRVHRREHKNWARFHRDDSSASNSSGYPAAHMATERMEDQAQKASGAVKHDSADHRQSAAQAALDKLFQEGDELQTLQYPTATYRTDQDLALS